MNGRGAFTVLGVATLLTGCFGAPPAPPRFFVPALTAPAGSVSGNTTFVRLRPVRTPVHLRERMVWRRSAVEYGFRGDDRWADLPETYVEQALATALASDRDLSGVERATLAIDLREFDEWIDGTHEARVALAAELLDRGRVLLRQTFSVGTPIATDAPEAVAHAMGTSLEGVAANVASAVRAALGEPHGARQGVEMSSDTRLGTLPPGLTTTSR